MSNNQKMLLRPLLQEAERVFDNSEERNFYTLLDRLSDAAQKGLNNEVLGIVEEIRENNRRKAQRQRDLVFVMTLEKLWRSGDRRDAEMVAVVILGLAWLEKNAENNLRTMARQLLQSEHLKVQHTEDVPEPTPPLPKHPPGTPPVDPWGQRYRQQPSRNPGEHPLDLYKRIMS